VFRAIWILSIVASLLYVAYLLGSGARELRNYSWQQYAAALLLGLALYPLSVAAQAGAWALSAGYLREQRLSFDWSDVELYAASYFFRRLPGGIWQVVGRVAAYRERGVGAAQPIAATASELTLLIATGAIVYLGSFYPNGSQLSIELGGAIGLAAILGGGLGGIVARAMKRRSPGRETGPERAIPVYALIAELYLAAYVVGGVIVYRLVDASGTGALSATQALQLWGLAGATLNLVTLVPFLIAAREVTVTLLLSRYVELPIAVAIALLIRILFIAGDLLWGVVLLLLARQLNRSIVAKPSAKQ
jgi:hypothetical protein